MDPRSAFIGQRPALPPPRSVRGEFALAGSDTGTDLDYLILQQFHSKCHSIVCGFSPVMLQTMSSEDSVNITDKLVVQQK